MIELLKRLIKEPKVMWHYFVGNYRMFMYKNASFLIRKHIKEQYKWRLTLMNPYCYNNGECVICGCKTPNLQFASKACEGDCYSDMVSKKLWKRIKNAKLCQ